MFELSNNKMKFCEEFVSLEGEGYTIGESVLFMRLSGGCGKEGICSCKFCDTKYSWQVKDEHKSLEDNDYLNHLKFITQSNNIRRITLTGGEPLVYIDQFVDFIKSMKSVVLDLKFLGIESNGSMLSKEKYVLELLKQFNTIKKLGIEPMLTISPKIDYDASWSNHKLLNQDSVDQIYFDVFKNIERILSPYSVFYKFIYDYTDEIIKWKHTNKFISNLLELGVPRNRIMLMALTPDDPNGKDSKFWLESQRKTAEKALELGLRYSPRLHVNLEMD